MSRLLTTIRYDATLQWRNGFYYVTLMIAGFWALLLPQASALNLRWLMPAMVIGNLLIGTFFFLGGLILLEKDERTPQALRVTPLRLSEYLASKTITLALPALIETTLITGLAVNWRFEPLLLILGLSLAIVIYCLIGYIAVAEASSLNTYIIQAGGYSALLLGAFYLVVDVWKYQKWCQPFVWMGMNSITIYLIKNFLGGTFSKLSARLLGGDIKVWLDDHVAKGFGDMVISIGGLLIAFWIVRFLYQRKIFLRV